LPIVELVLVGYFICERPGTQILLTNAYSNIPFPIDHLPPLVYKVSEETLIKKIDPAH
jgi:hypothetical protein